MRERAAAALNQAGVVRLPVRLQPLAASLGVGLFTYEDYARVAEVPLEDVVRRRGADGFAMEIAGHTAVFYRAGSNLCRVRWTIAHELGHLLLGHMARVCADDAGVRARQEREANLLAAELLCPTAVVAACGCTTPEVLAALCDISPTAARAAQRQHQDVGMLTAAEQQLVANCAGWVREQCVVTGALVTLPRVRSRRL